MDSTSTLTEFLLFIARRGVSGDVYDRRPEEVLRSHEEDGQQEAHESDTPT